MADGLPSTSTGRGSSPTGDEFPSTEPPLSMLRFNEPPGAVTDDPSVRDGEQERLRQRQLVIGELCEVEELFVRDMSVVREIWEGTAEACPRLDPKTIRLIFRNIGEVVDFHRSFYNQLVHGVAGPYIPADQSFQALPTDVVRNLVGGKLGLDEEKDRQTSIGPLFTVNIDKFRKVHSTNFRSSEHSAKRLIQIRDDPIVRVWMNECEAVSSDLTRDNVDLLLVKPIQHIAKYPEFIAQLLKHTPKDHPDREELERARGIVTDAIYEVHLAKVNFQLVEDITAHKQPYTYTGLAKAVRNRVQRPQRSESDRFPEDEKYVMLCEKFHDDYLRLQITLRDIEMYIPATKTYIRDFLQYLSCMELIMRLQPSADHDVLVQKWVQLAVSMQDLQGVLLEQHFSDVRKQVIEPFERVLICYSNPALVVKRRAQRRLDYELYLQLKSRGKKIDKKLEELVKEYEAINETLKKELPRLWALTAKIGNICLTNFINIQTRWYSLWQAKLKEVLPGALPQLTDLDELVRVCRGRFAAADKKVRNLGVCNGVPRGEFFQPAIFKNAGSTFHSDQNIVEEDDNTGTGAHISIEPSEGGEKSSVLPAPVSRISDPGEDWDPRTDSGYASASYTKGTRKDARAGVDNEDAATEYSSTPSMASSQQEKYTLELADDLFCSISTWNLDHDAQGRIMTALPDLLKDFALKVGYSASSQMHRDIMAYVHRYRWKITQALKGISLQKVDESLDRAVASPEDMPLHDKMNLWLSKENYEQIGAKNDELTELQEMMSIYEDDEEGPDNALLAYRDFVSRTEAYRWLIARLRREHVLVPAEPDTMRLIRKKIMSSLPPTRTISRKVGPDGYTVRFEVDWDPHAFFAQQQYGVEPAEALERVITLTGDPQDAQATTCSEYISQTWPLTGERILQIVREVLAGEPGRRHFRTFEDGSSCGAWIDGDKVMVECTGVAAFIAETGEQLAWLGAALRASPWEGSLYVCRPAVDVVPQLTVTPRLGSPQVVYDIAFAGVEIQQSSTRPNGQCWHDLFAQPFVVQGFPIPRRTNPNTGMEAQLNILAGLARTQRVDQFRGSIFIKGFYTMLVPTKFDRDTLYWHLIYRRDGGRVSYLDNTIPQEPGLGYLDLENVRHVLGWCSEARFYAGSAQAAHPVVHAGLPRAQEGCALGSIYVVAGRLIKGGPAFLLGTRETPPHMPRSGYIQRLKWISTKFVLLWDEADKRGWLVNGTSALLHIVRASLQHDSTDKFQSAFVFKNEDLQESSNLLSPDSATDMLINTHNLKLKLYPEDDGYLLLKDRIEYYCNVLEKVIDHQADIAGYCGTNMADKPRKHLEGWDFAELATNRDPLYARVATIGPKAKGWVDFMRAIQAVTLLGRGFGEIIRPAGQDFCEYWEELPKHQYYVATCLSDLDQVLKENEYYCDSHVRVSENIIWHTPSVLFGSCRCRGALSSTHCEPVQTLFPSNMARILLPRKQTIPQASKGAVIFGQSSTFGWIWGDTGYPEEGDLASASITSDSDSNYDSGIGTSLRSSELDGPTTRLELRPKVSFALEHAPSGKPSAGLPASEDDSAARVRRRYTVGLLCALPLELLAVRALFDRKYPAVEIPSRDNNTYALGQIGQHMVVAACLPAGDYGTNSASHSFTNMTRSFEKVQFCLLVGIGGGAPSDQNDIRLGDVVVSLPTGNKSDIIQYDRGKAKQDSPFELTGSLPPPPRYLASAISSLRSDPDLPPDPLRGYLDDVAARLPEYRHPGRERDLLLSVACQRCQHRRLCPERVRHIVKREPRPNNQPKIHYGLIASGNRVLKDSSVRDAWARQHGVLCFEMEAAGVKVSDTPCLVIRGVSDYADASKNKEWQPYAAAAAAAYAKLLLTVVVSKDLERSL